MSYYISDMAGYEPSEEDIEKMIHVLKVRAPEYATREWALTVLGALEKGVHELSVDNPDALQDVLNKLKQADA